MPEPTVRTRDYNGHTPADPCCDGTISACGGPDEAPPLPDPDPYPAITAQEALATVIIVGKTAERLALADDIAELASDLSQKIDDAGEYLRAVEGKTPLSTVTATPPGTRR